MSLPERFFADAQRIIARYPDGQSRSALLPLLYLAQSEESYVSREAMRAIGDLLGLSSAEVGAVATFYTMFKREPQGRWLVSVCTQPSCTLAGARGIVSALESELGVSCGSTSADGAISTEEVECLCVCDRAPVVSVNYENYYGKTPEEIVEIVRALRNGDAPPVSSQGEAPEDFAAVNRRMSGVDGPVPVVRGVQA